MKRQPCGNTDLAALVDPRAGTKTLSMGAIAVRGEDPLARVMWVSPDGAAYAIREVPAGNHTCRGDLIGWSRHGSVLTPAAASPVSARSDSIAFSSDSRLAGGFASYQQKLYGDAMLWNTDTGSKVRLLKGPEQYSTAAAFSSDGRLFAVGSEDQTAWVWQVASGKVVAVLRGHAGAVNDVAFSPDGRFVATAGDDGTVRLWRTDTGEEIWRVQVSQGLVHDVAFTPDGQYLVAVPGWGDSAVYRCEVCGSFNDLLRLARSRAVRTLTSEERAVYLHQG